MRLRESNLRYRLRRLVLGWRLTRLLLAAPRFRALLAGVGRMRGRRRGPIGQPVCLVDRNNEHPQIIVVVDRSDRRNYPRYQATVRGLLAQQGFPFLELAGDDSRLADGVSAACRLVIIGHDCAAGRLTASAVAALAAAVRRGTGVLNFDTGVRFGWSGAGELTRGVPAAPARRFRSVVVRHAGTVQRLPLRRALEYIPAASPPPLPYPLSTGEGEDALLEIAGGGAGRLGNCLFPLELWDESSGSPLGYYGRILTLLVFQMAGEPLVWAPLPQYLTMRIDDVRLNESAYLDGLSAAGVRPLCGIFIDEVDPQQLRRYREVIDITPHGTSWDERVFTASDFVQNHLPRMLAFRERHQLRYATVLMPHRYRLARECLPALADAGFTGTIIAADPSRPGAYWGTAPPFGLPSYNCTFLEGGRLFNYIAEDYHRDKFHDDSLWDFLFGLTAFDSPADGADLPAIIERCHRTAVKALAAGFPAMLVTHEERLAHLPAADLSKIVAGLLERLRQDGFTPAWVGMEQLFAYLRDWHGIRFASCAVVANRLRVELAGRTLMPLTLCCRHRGETRQFTVPPFTGTHNHEITLA